MNLKPRPSSGAAGLFRGRGSGRARPRLSEALLSSFALGSTHWPLVSLRRGVRAGLGSGRALCSPSFGAPPRRLRRISNARSLWEIFRTSGSLERKNPKSAKAPAFSSPVLRPAQADPKRAALCVLSPAPLRERIRADGERKNFACCGISPESIPNLEAFALMAEMPPD